MPTSFRFLFLYFLKLKLIPVFFKIKYRKDFLLFSILRNPNAPNYLRNRFQFLSDSREPLGPFTRASLFNLKVPYLQGNSGERTLAYSATKLFNKLSSDLKEFSFFFCADIKFLPSFPRSDLRNLFLSRLSSVEHLEDLLCLIYCYSIHCKCSS